MSLLQKMSTALFIALLTAMLIPFGSLSADQPKGTVVITVQDENGEAFSGDWYLHSGTTINGFVLRNGSAGEVFQKESGSYFLEVRNLFGSHPYHLLYSDNPQFLLEDETITFNVQYFKTEEQMLIASGNPPPEPPAPEPENEGEGGYDIYDVHGCNSTQGFVWCAKSEACVKYWSPACQVDEAEEEEEVADETSESTTPTILATSPAVHVPTFETPPRAVVPTFETPPYAFAPEVPEIGGAMGLPIQLAQTGPSVGLVLIASMLIGLASIRRRD